MNLIEYDNKERSLPEVKRETRGEERRAPRRDGRRKPAFGLAGLTYSRRYTATNDDVSLPLRKRSDGRRRAAFCILPGLKSPAFVTGLALRWTDLKRQSVSSGYRDDVGFNVIIGTS